MFLVITRTLLFTTLALLIAGQTQAGDLYRVELLLFERVHGAPEAVSNKEPVTLPEHGLPLWINTDWTPDDSARSAIDNDSRAILKRPDIVALPSDELRLEPIARSLENQSGYRVLSLTGWHNELPPGYRSVPLVVDLTTNEDGNRRIRGSLNLERRRYLHVDVDLSHMRAVEPAFEVTPIPVAPTSYPGELVQQTVPQSRDFLYPESEKQWLTETWLDELRRMRSEEIHYMDAPTFGLIVYFHPLRDDGEDEGDEE